MENYLYKCDVCGYAHIVPAYLMSFSPDEVLEQSHLDVNTGKPCSNEKLRLIEETD